jgi:hypothetical protein
MRQDRVPLWKPGDVPDDDGRGSWIPTRAMIAARCMELRKRRGLMITLIALTIGLPTLFLVIRLLLHAFVPQSYGPAGGFAVFTSLIAGVLYIFGFIAAMTLGATAGCSDLADGMFTQQVVTGRSRVALYLARIPAVLALIIPMVAVARSASSPLRPVSTSRAAPCPSACPSMDTRPGPPTIRI